MLLAEKIAKLRKDKDESLQDVATAIGYSKAHVWELEAGKSKKPSIELVKRLADHFQVSVAWLIGEATFKGKDEENSVALYRAVNQLSSPNRQIIQTIVEGMLKGDKAE